MVVIAPEAPQPQPSAPEASSVVASSGAEQQRGIIQETKNSRLVQGIRGLFGSGASPQDTMQAIATGGINVESSSTASENQGPTSGMVGGEGSGTAATNKSNAAIEAPAVPVNPGNVAENRAIILTPEERAALQQKAFKEITDMNLGIDLATASPTQIMDALKQRGWDENASFDYAMGGRDQAIALRQEEARQKITAPDMGITLTADTNIDDLMQALVQKGWQNDEPTKTYAQGALDLVKQEAAQAAVNVEPSAATSEAPAAQQADATTGQQESANQTPRTVEDVKAEAAAKDVIDIVKGREKETLSVEDQAVMETFTKMIMKESQAFSEFYQALKKDDPAYAAELKHKLELYKRMMEGKKTKYYMAAGLALFIIYTLGGAVLTGGQQH